MATDENSIAAELLAILACPRCHGKLATQVAASGSSELGCSACKLAFAVKDGVPNFLLEDARTLGGGR